jgi:hypothetical protein
MFNRPDAGERKMREQCKPEHGACCAYTRSLVVTPILSSVGFLLRAALTS